MYTFLYKGIIPFLKTNAAASGIQVTNLGIFANIGYNGIFVL